MHGGLSNINRNTRLESTSNKMTNDDDNTNTIETNENTIVL